MFQIIRDGARDSPREYSRTSELKVMIVSSDPSGGLCAPAELCILGDERSATNRELVAEQIHGILGDAMEITRYDRFQHGSADRCSRYGPQRAVTEVGHPRETCGTARDREFVTWRFSEEVKAVSHRRISAKRCGIELTMLASPIRIEISILDNGGLGPQSQDVAEHRLQDARPRSSVPVEQPRQRPFVGETDDIRGLAFP